MLGVTTVMGVPLAGPADWAAYFEQSLSQNADPSYVRNTEFPAAVKKAMGPNADPAVVAATVASGQAQFDSTYQSSVDLTNEQYGANDSTSIVLLVLAGGIGLVVVSKAIGS